MSPPGRSCPKNSDAHWSRSCGGLGKQTRISKSRQSNYESRLLFILRDRAGRTPQFWLGGRLMPIALLCQAKKPCMSRKGGKVWIMRSRNIHIPKSFSAKNAIEADNLAQTVNSRSQWPRREGICSFDRVTTRM